MSPFRCAVRFVRSDVRFTPGPRGRGTGQRWAATVLGTAVLALAGAGPATAQTAPASDAAASSAATATAPRPLRIAFYNIEFFNQETPAVRLDKLRDIVRKIDADVWGLSEISNREALALIFPPDQYQVMLQDSRKEQQKVALVVKKPLAFAKPEATMVFPGADYDAAFPGERDLLGGTVLLPGGQPVFCFVVHAKSRFGGREKSEERRREHSRLIVEYLRKSFKLDQQAVVVMGDFNDTPDDASLNILETGDPKAPARAENEPDPFMVNLGEPLWAKELATIGLSKENVGPDGKVNLQVPGARQHNLDIYGQPDVAWKPVIFDLLVVSPFLSSKLSAEGLRIYDQADAVGKPEPKEPNVKAEKDPERASDHLPVFADFDLR